MAARKSAPGKKSPKKVPAKKAAAQRPPKKPSARSSAVERAPGKSTRPTGKGKVGGSSPPARTPKARPARKAAAPTPEAGTTERLLHLRPAPDQAQDAPLTTNEQAFVTEYLRNGQNGTAAWIFVHPGTTPAAAAVTAHRTLKRAKVRALIDAERARLSASHQIDRDSLLAEFLAIARADPNELMQMRAVACKTCWPGSDPSAAPVYTDPDPECAQCMGEGHVVPWIADTRKLSPAARALYAGVQQTQHGIRILTHDKVAALVNIGKIIGAFEEDNSQKAKPLAEALREFFGGLHGNRLPIAKHQAQPTPLAAGRNPLVRG